MYEDTRLVYMLEDDSDDRFITETTVAELQVPVDIHFFSSSTSFLNFLTTAPAAALILIDYNSQPDNGVETLRQIKKLAKHSVTPVVILSDNKIEKYKEECYANGAASFIQKPSKMERTTQMIRTFFSYWLEVAQV